MYPAVLQACWKISPISKNILNIIKVNRYSYIKLYTHFYFIHNSNQVGQYGMTRGSYKDVDITTYMNMHEH